MLCGYVCMDVAGRTVTRSNVFAQASLSRLGETCRNMLGSCSSSRSGGELSFERGDISLRREGSPKRECMGALACRCTFGLGEEPHLWERGGLAQASWSRSGELVSPKRAFEEPPRTSVTVSPERESAA